MLRASGTDRASRSSLATTRVSTSRQALHGGRDGRGTSGEPLVDVDPVDGYTQRCEGDRSANAEQASAPWLSLSDTTTVVGGAEQCVGGYGDDHPE